MLVQNPPSIPTLLLAIIVCRLRGTKPVIDWHNFGYSILAMKLGIGHPLVTAARLYEFYLANFAYCHFTVTNAMRAELRNSGVTKSIFVLHDRPAPIFEPLTSEQRIRFLTNYGKIVDQSQDVIAGKTKLLVSSTSWTADEDFGVLLEALCQYSTSAISDLPQLPELLIVITGKGPQREHYIKRIADLKRNQELEMVDVRTDWLSFDDYAALLGSADLGVSLHTSSSGVDLPMKVVDMFGAGLPVVGYSNFKAWPELVQENVNGKGFSNGSEMASILKSLLDPANDQLQTLREGALRESQRRWSSEWNSVAGRLFETT